MRRDARDISLNALLQAAFPGHDNPVMVVGWKTRRILAASESMARVFGYRPDELQDRTTEVLHVDRHSFERFGEMTEAALAKYKDSFHGYYRMVRRDGSRFDTENFVSLVRDHQGHPVAAVSMVRDLSEVQPLGPDQQSPQPGFRALNQNLPGAVFERVSKPDGTIVHGLLQGNLGARLGIADEHAQQNVARILALIVPADRRRMREALNRSVASGCAVDVDIRAHTVDGDPRWLRCIAQPQRMDDGSMALGGILLDITEQKEAEQGLRRLAMYDGLTGLPNTATFDQRLEGAIDHARRAGRRLVVAELDIERFHAINESLGYGFGDQALRVVGERLSTVAFGNDLVARFQGDEFLVLRQDIGSNEEVVGVAQQLLSLFEEPLRLDGDNRFLVKPRLGLSVYPEDGDTPDALRRSADLALQRARRNRGAGYAFYSSEMTRDVLAALELEDDLREAIRCGEIGPVYQAQYDVSGTDIIGVEALARWTRRDGNAVSPGRFIPLAEDTGLIHDLGRLLVEQVLADIVQWRAGECRVPPVSLNVSAHQVRDGTDQGDR
ncbi:diguanylate cyclase [Ectothiorhodospiraceae bacterium WFHF3C12]|nr:diguanylate cyclase [Ectothiorhodospiraceae bacterium WFHF3C12]